MTVKKINVVDVNEHKDKVATESIMWNILEESRPCCFRKIEETVRFCDALNRILYHNTNRTKSIVTPEKCAECEFSDVKRNK